MRKLPVLLALLLAGIGTSGPAAAQVPEIVFVNERQFRIPFTPGPNAQNLKQLQLLVSGDQGKGWQHAASVAPNEGHFRFVAARDGTFWFAVQALDFQQKLYPPTADGLVPSMKVVVDTLPPVVQLQPLAPRGNEVGVAWDVRDDNPDLASADALRLEYRLAGTAAWQPLAVTPGATQHYWPAPHNSSVEVRLRARDRANNTGEATTTVSSAGVVNPMPAPNPQPNPPAQEIFNQPGVGERRFVNSKRVSLNCELKDYGPSGVSLMELWYTQDGKNWQKGPEYKIPMGEEMKPQTIQFDVNGEGVYGITLVARSGVGLGDRPPQVGDRPQLWIEVDLTKPVVELQHVIVGAGADKGKLTVTWAARDKNLPAEPITLSYAEKADGPWKAFAEKLPNNGRYVWTMPTEGLPYQFFVRVEAADRAGNVGDATTRELVRVDLATPKVLIRDVAPSK